VTNVNPENQSSSGLPLRGLAMVLIAVAVLLAMWGLYASTQNSSDTADGAGSATSADTTAVATAPGQSASPEADRDATTTDDADTDADALADLLRGTDGHVNLIPVNPVLGLPATASDAGRTAAFAARLKARGVNATVRRRLGADIDAACGQLRLQEAGRIPEDTVAAYL